MFTLLVLRHADAVPQAESDYARALTEKGNAQAKTVGKFLAAQKIVPTLVLHSPFLRAVQTAEIVGSVLGVKPVRETFLGCGMQPETAMAYLRPFVRRDEPILLVGHEPDLGNLMGVLIGGDAAPARLDVKKASLWSLGVEQMRPGGAWLQFSLPPKMM